MKNDREWHIFPLLSARHHTNNTKRLIEVLLILYGVTLIIFHYLLVHIWLKLGIYIYKKKILLFDEFHLNFLRDPIVILLLLRLQGK